MKASTLRGCAVLALLSFASQPARAQNIGFLKVDNTYTTIAFPGAIDTNPMAINNLGRIAGTYYDGTSAHGFIWNGGTYSSFDYPGARSTSLVGMNDLGQMVGSYTDATGIAGGHFFYDGSTFTTLAVPGAASTRVADINNVGQIVGLYTDNSGYHGYVTNGASYTTILYPGAALSAATSINNAGDIAGYFKDTTNPILGFLKTGNDFAVFDIWSFLHPGVVNFDGFFTMPLAVNDAGQMIVYTQGFSYLWDGSGYSQIRRPNYTEGFKSFEPFFTYANDLNNAGHIVGYANSNVRVPEGGTSTLMLGLGLLGLVGLRRSLMRCP